MTDEELRAYILSPVTGLISRDKLKRKLTHVPTTQLERVLDSLPTYQINKASRPSSYTSIKASFSGDIIQADLMDVSSSTTANQGAKFLLTFIDVYSRYALAQPIKNKNQTITTKLNLFAALPANDTHQRDYLLVGLNVLSLHIMHLIHLHRCGSKCTDAYPEGYTNTLCKDASEETCK